jgi:hypothetical protein
MCRGQRKNLQLDGKISKVVTEVKDEEMHPLIIIVGRLYIFSISKLNLGHIVDIIIL